VKDTPPLPYKNYFNVLAVEEIKIDSSTTTDVSPVPETARTEKTRKSKLERRLPKKTQHWCCGSRPKFPLPLGGNRKYGQSTEVRSPCLGRLRCDWAVHRPRICKVESDPHDQLPQLIPVFNVDGTANTEGSISEVAELLLRYNGHSERALFCVTGLGRQNLILGHTWLKDHNPEVDWRTGKVEMSRCSPWCCNGC